VTAFLAKYADRNSRGDPLAGITFGWPGDVVHVALADIVPLAERDHGTETPETHITLTKGQANMQGPFSMHLHPTSAVQLIGKVLQHLLFGMDACS
jgi:hypothetical protein